MKLNKILLLLSTIMCTLLSICFTSFADTNINSNNENNEIIVPAQDPSSNVGTTPELITETIVEDNIYNAEMPAETIKNIKNNTSTEIIDEEVPLSVSVVGNQNNTAVHLDDTPKTGDNIYIYYILSLISLIIIIYSICLNYTHNINKIQNQL